MELTNTSKFQLDLERKDTFQRVVKGAVSNFKNNAQETHLFVSDLWFCHLHVLISLLTLSSIAIECE